MSTIKPQELKIALQKDEKSASLLNKSYTSLLKNEKSIQSINIQLEQNFSMVAQNETQNMKKLFEDTSNCLKNVNTSHLKYV